MFLIMGVLNVTPDSFSDGGTIRSGAEAVAQAKRMASSGADIIDVGAESTRPGALSVSSEDEWARLHPILLALLDSGLMPSVSVDTRWGVNALRALTFGVRMFNNVTGLYETDVLKQISATSGTRYIAMHMQGEPATMQESPMNREEALEKVPQFLQKSRDALLINGFSSDRIFVDPGIGFGKSDEANLALISQTSAMSRDGNIAIGISRKGFIGRLLNISEPKDRDDASKVLEMSLAMMGAQLIRTHEVERLARIRELL